MNVPDLSDTFTQRDTIEEASYLLNLVIKEVADTKFELLLCCRLSIFNLFPWTGTVIFLCGTNFSLVNEKIF